MRSAIDWRRWLLGFVEVLASALMVLLWTALVRDVDKAMPADLPSSCTAQDTGCPPAATTGAGVPTSSASGVVAGS